MVLASPGGTISRARLRRSTILSALGPDHALTILFLGTYTRTSQWNFLVGHPSWECSRVNSLNFGVPMEPEANELPKCLVLCKDGNIHIRITPLDDRWEYTYKAYMIHSPGQCGMLQSTPLGARRPHRHTSGQGLGLIPNCHIPTRARPLPGLDSAVARNCPLWTPTTPSRFCFWELKRAELPSRSLILGML
ncbi:hypothetical protein DVH24_019937 [Malus domestica]|uniref:Uncharacterized protein n=1 Tax=Malus domestica TaxID=3750 RepID=A0A498I272_MALDO|nr:hypothetical protein DVH24_019937 [Malus domestica]